MTSCPQCGYPQYCPCKSCQDKLPKNYFPWVWDKKGELISCGNCGFTAHADWWDEHGHRRAMQFNPSYRERMEKAQREVKESLKRGEFSD